MDRFTNSVQFPWELYDDQDEPYEVEVVAYQHGRYRPPTREEPEEFPELEMDVYVGEKKITDNLTWKEIDELQQECWDAFDRG